MPTVSTYYNNTRNGDYLRHTVPAVSLGGTTVDITDDYREAYMRWITLRDVYAGADVVKAKGTTYLRRLAAHTHDEDYKAYLSRATFYNGLSRTHNGLLTSMLKEHPSFSISSQLAEYLPEDNVNASGWSLQRLARHLASEVILLNRAGLLVDLPIDALPDQRPAVHLNFYAAETIHYVRQSIFRGQSLVDRVVLIENVVENTEYSATSRTRYRVLRLDYNPIIDDMVYSQELHTPGADPRAAPTVQFIPISVRGRTLNYIPFVFFSTTGNSPDLVKPPLLDLAYLNLSHYESSALLEHGRFYAAMPTYYIRSNGNTAALMEDVAAAAEGSGKMAPQKGFSVGPSNIWLLEQEDVPGLLEFNGHGLQFVENAVDSKQLQMQSLGGRMIPTQRRAAALSDEAYELMELGDEAILLFTARSCSEGLTKALRWAEEMLNLSVPESSRSSAAYSENFSRPDISSRELSLVQALFDAGLLPEDDLYRTLRRLGLLAQETTKEAFRTLLERRPRLPAPGTPNPGARPSRSPATSRGPDPARDE